MNAPRYGALDALRGIAALLVVGFHLSQIGMIPVIVPRAYLAVDFFFILSGFVIAHAYENNLRTRLTLRSFLIKRAIRLYPLAFLGAGLGVLVLLLKWILYPEKVESLGLLLATGALNLAILPSFLGATAASHDLFPGNGPLWSLFFELLINLAWATFGIWLRTSTLIAIALVSLTFLAFFASQYHTLNIGYDTATFWAGWARICFGFPLGVVIYRERHRINAGSRQWGILSLSAALIAVFAIPADLTSHVFPWIDLLIISICLPAIMMGGMTQMNSTACGNLLGGLSYPVYVLHFPILLMMSGLHQSLLSKWNIHIIACMSVLAVLLISWMAWRLYDEPLRRVLTVMTCKRGEERYTRPSPSERLDGASQSDGRQADVRV